MYMIISSRHICIGRENNCHCPFKIARIVAIGTQCIPLGSPRETKLIAYIDTLNLETAKG